MADEPRREYTDRTYRTLMAAEDLVGFAVAVEQTDLLVLAERDLSAEAARSVRKLRTTLEEWVDDRPDFATSNTGGTSAKSTSKSALLATPPSLVMNSSTGFPASSRTPPISS